MNKKKRKIWHIEAPYEKIQSSDYKNSSYYCNTLQEFSDDVLHAMITENCRNR